MVRRTLIAMSAAALLVGCGDDDEARERPPANAERQQLAADHDRTVRRRITVSPTGHSARLDLWTAPPPGQSYQATVVPRPEDLEILAARVECPSGQRVEMMPVGVDSDGSVTHIYARCA